MQDTTNRITGGLQKAGERISNALSGGSQKQTVKKDDGGQPTGNAGARVACFVDGSSEMLLERIAALQRGTPAASS